MSARMMVSGAEDVQPPRPVGVSGVENGGMLAFTAPLPLWRRVSDGSDPHGIANHDAPSLLHKANGHTTDL